MSNNNSKSLLSEDILGNTINEKLAMRYIDSSNSSFAPTAGGFVSLDFGSSHYNRVMICCAFPFTDPDRFISVREYDGKHNEIGIIDDLNLMSSDTAALIRNQIKLRYFTPEITRVYSAKDKGGFSTLDVQTDRGRCKFIIRSGSDSVIRLSETRLIFCDIDSNRFEIKNISLLSKKEQKKLDLYI